MVVSRGARSHGDGFARRARFRIRGATQREAAGSAQSAPSVLDNDLPDLPERTVAAHARLSLGTSTKKDTVNAALREVLENRRRALALTRLRDATAEGAFDVALLQDKLNYRR